MGDPITHIHLRREDIKEILFNNENFSRNWSIINNIIPYALQRRFNGDLADYFRSLGFNSYVPDSIYFLRIHPKLKHIFSDVEIFHKDAITLDKLCSAVPSLRYPFMALHKFDDKWMHDKYIMPMAFEFAQDYEKLRKRGDKGVDIAHSIIENMIGVIIRENDPHSKGERDQDYLKNSIYETRKASKDFSIILSQRYGGSWHAYYHMLNIANFFQRYIYPKTDRFIDIITAYIMADSPKQNNLKEKLIDQMTLFSQATHESIVDCAGMFLPDELYLQLMEYCKPEIEEDFKGLIYDAKERIIRFDRNKIKDIKNIEIPKKDNVLPYLIALRDAA